MPAEKPFQRVTAFAAERKLLTERLVAYAGEDVLAYAELSDLAGFNVVRQNRHVLDAARRDCERETGKLYAAVPGVGLKIASDEERVGLARVRIRGAGRKAKRAAVIASGADVSKLDNAGVASLNATLTQAVTIGRLCGARATKKITEAVVEAQGKLPASKALKLFT